MNDSNIKGIPAIHREIERKSAEIGFTMPSDIYIGTLLKTLISSKPAGKFLELGTGIGLSLSWMIDGMDKNANLITVDNMSTQSNWPEGHDENVDRLVSYLENREDFNLTKMDWSTGLIIAVKIK